jgi:hypothetical protein
MFVLVVFLSRSFYLSKLVVGCAGRGFPSRVSGRTSHQLLFEHRFLREPMMSCLTLGSRLGRNAPHLSDDPLRTSSSVEQRSTLRPNQNGNCVS